MQHSKKNIYNLKIILMAFLKVISLLYDVGKLLLKSFPCDSTFLLVFLIEKLKRITLYITEKNSLDKKYVYSGS